MFPIEAFRESVLKATRLFTAQSIPFHLTGGIASVAYGEPRMTQDIDIVVDNASIAGRLSEFLAALAESGFLYDETAVRSAVSSRSMFQLFDSAEALKLDIYSREMIPGELKRSTMIEVFEGVHLPVASCADAAVTKLVWVSKGSHKSRRDFRQIFRLADESDQRTIRQLADQLGVSQLMEEVLAESDELQA